MGAQQEERAECSPTSSCQHGQQPERVPRQGAVSARGTEAAVPMGTLGLLGLETLFRGEGVCGPVPLSCVALDKALHLSEPWAPQLRSRKAGVHSGGVEA